MIRLLLIALVLLAACGDPNSSTGPGPDEGVAIGNPGLMGLDIAGSESFAFSSATIRLSGIDVFDERWDSHYEALDRDVDLISGEPVPLVGGSWRGIGLAFTGILSLDANWTGPVGEAASVQLRIALDSVDLVRSGSDPVRVDEASTLIFELGQPGWLDGVTSILSDGAELQITEGDPLYDELLLGLQDDSRLFDDSDASGSLEPAERDGGPLAIAGILWEQASGDSASAMGSESAGCSASMVAVRCPNRGGIFLLLGLLALRRRRAPSA